MKKCNLMVVAVLMSILLAVPAFALLDDDHSINTSSSASSNATGGQGGNSENDNRNTNTNLNNADSRSDQSQGQGQLQGQAQGQLQGQLQGQGQGQIANGSVDVSVQGDNVKHVMGESLWLNAPTTTALQGQQASSVYSIFGGVNLAQTAEYQICKEKIDVATLMVKNGYLTLEEGKAEALKAYAELLDNTQAKRILWIGPKTRGVHLGNLFGILSMDSCNEINTDNWLGTKDILTKPFNKK